MIGRLAAVFVFVVCAVAVFWFALVHTLHFGTLSVPDLRGTTVEEAERQAHDIGLTVRLDDPGVFSPAYPPGTIAAQSPHPGFHVKTGANLVVRLSLGQERVAVPDLSGQSSQAAQQALTRVGLKAGRRSRVRGELGSEGVLASDPPAGHETRPATEVALLVNETPARQLWVMPTLLLRTAPAVVAFCQRNHLRLGQVHEVAYPGVTPGMVLRQYPAAGSPLSRSDIITVWISR